MHLFSKHRKNNNGIQFTELSKNLARYRCENNLVRLSK